MPAFTAVPSALMLANLELGRVIPILKQIFDILFKAISMYIFKVVYTKKF